MQAPPASPPAAVAPPTGSSTTLIIAQGNIAEESTDIIVNTTSEDMTLNKSAVSRAILEKAGVELQKTCNNYVENGMRLDHGQIVVTPAVGKLRCRKIIHAHVPHQGSIATSTHHCQLIEKIVIDCLQRAENEKMESISFPAFGLNLGGGGYLLAEPMLQAFQKFGQTHPKSVKSIRVVINDPDLYKQFNDLYCKFFGRSSSDPTPPPSLWDRLKLIGSNQKVNSVSQELQAEGVASNKPPPIWALSHSIRNPIVVFTIFGASDDQCEKIATILKNLIKEKSTTKTITDVHIEQLIDDDLKEILQIGDKHGVHVKMVAKIKEIHISGETSNVLEAHSEIQKILSDISRSMITLRDFEWSSAEDDGRFEAYPPEASMRLERALNRGMKAIELTVDNVVVLIDIQNRVETDKTSGKRRNISRSKNSMGSVGECIYALCTYVCSIIPTLSRAPFFPTLSSFFAISPTLPHYPHCITKGVEREEGMQLYNGRERICCTCTLMAIEDRVYSHKHQQAEDKDDSRAPAIAKKQTRVAKPKVKMYELLL